jgi:hypothetical protein
MRSGAYRGWLIGLAAAGVCGVALAGGIASAAQITLTPTGPNPATAAVGEAVTFANADTVPHTVTSAKGGYTSGVIMPGGSFTWWFPTSGSYFYRDLGGAPGKRGRVRVAAPPGPAPPTVARPALTLRAARAMAVTGQQTALVGLAVPAVPALELQLRTPDSGWSTVAPVLPGPDGSFRTVVVAQSAGAYRVATPNHHSTSATVMVHVQPRVVLRAPRRRAVAGTELRFAVRAWPVGVRVAELRSWNERTGTWRRLTGATVDADGRATLRWQVKAGRHWVRATIPPHRGELKLTGASSLTMLVVGTAAG